MGPGRTNGERDAAAARRDAVLEGGAGVRSVSHGPGTARSRVRERIAPSLARMARSSRTTVSRGASAAGAIARRAAPADLRRLRRALVCYALFLSRANAAAEPRH